jgi:hypothetical protein
MSKKGVLDPGLLPPGTRFTATAKYRKFIAKFDIEIAPFDDSFLPARPLLSLNEMPSKTKSRSSALSSEESRGGQWIVRLLSGASILFGVVLILRRKKLSNL